MVRGHRAVHFLRLIGPDRVLAVLSVFFDDTAAALDEPRFDLLQSLGNLAAIALSEAHTKEQIRRSQSRLELAMEAGRMVCSAGTSAPAGSSGRPTTRCCSA